jgi:potassium efflux system protein
MLRFSGEIFSMLIRRRPKGWLVRLRFIWYSLAVGVPLVLAILAGMGYYYSAYALYLRLGETIALLLCLILVKDLVLRWFFITQRRLTYEEVKRKAEARAEESQKESAAGGLDVKTVVIEEPEINLDQIYEKNRVLLRTLMFFSALIGLWLIWANVLPALNFLENIQLWNYSSEVEGVPTQVPITLADLMAAVIIAIVTVVAAKNLPGLLEVILLNWLPMDYGARHAITTIFSYAITALGVMITFATIGIKWSNIQWLIAALGVGLGFGLQEVVANFICGLIVLFERPFRIGDTVTIADISGTVTRIKIRATTIMDWDRKELIVPNKEFITGRLINWSLSDNIIRIKVPIGIAYGSDTALAEKLLLKAAKANPLVLDKPDPQAVFLGFGDNSLNFELRVFINGIDDWIPMLHKLNQTVDGEFRKAKVTISFPQRDVHLDQVGPLEVRVVSDRSI